jgi:hypothetical protein
VPPRPADCFVHEVMSINDLVAFATGVRFAIDAIEMIETDDKHRPGSASGAARSGVPHTEGSKLPVCCTEVYIDRESAAVGLLRRRDDDAACQGISLTSASRNLEFIGQIILDTLSIIRNCRSPIAGELILDVG